MISRPIKALSGGFEAFLAIPLLGGSIVLFSDHFVLKVMLILHIIGLIFAVVHHRQKAGHILGILASLLGYIFLIGWFLHVITAIVLLIEASRNR